MKTARDARALLDEAVLLERSGAGRQALEQYLASWVLVRSAAIADRIDHLSKALEPSLPVVDVTGAGGFKAAVVKRISASSTLDVGPVLTLLRLRQRAAGALFVGEQLISMLRRHPHDPRLTRAAWEACRNLRISQATATGRSTFLQLCGLALAVRDPRFSPGLIDEARAALGAFPTRDAKGQHETRALQTLAESAAAEVAAEPAWVAQVLATTQKQEPRPLSALLEAVFAAPDDVARRLVYADALQEMGDPRGEFIALQCSRGGGKVSAREKELLRNHGRAWLGEHEKGIERDGLEFRRGFIAAARVRWKHALVGPQWATIEALDLPQTYGGREDAALVCEFLRRDDLRVLRALWVTSDCLAPLKRRLPNLACLGLSEEVDDRTLGFFPRLRRFETHTLDASAAKSLVRRCPSLEVVHLRSAEGVPLLSGSVRQVELSMRSGLEQPKLPLVFVLRGERLDQLEVVTLGRRLPEWAPGFVEQWVAQLPRGFVSSVTLAPEVDLPWLRQRVRPCVKKGGEWLVREARVPSWQDVVWATGDSAS